MDFKRIFRTPMLWIVVLIGAAILVLSLSDNGGFTRIDTSKALDLINNGRSTPPSSSTTSGWS